MKIAKKLSAMGGDVWQTVRRYPVELLMAVYAFVAAALMYHDIKCEWFTRGVALVPIFFALAYILNTSLAAKRWIYFVAWLAIVPLSFLPGLAEWDETVQFRITALILCPLAVLVARWQRDDDRYADDALAYVVSWALALVFSIVVLLAFMAIYYSAVYIFDLSAWRHIWFYAPWVIVGLLGTVLFLDFQSHRLGRRISAGNVGTALANYVLTPALLIYTAILYIYAVKILFTWELPRGGVAIMVFVFCMVAVALRAVRHTLDRRMYDRFFDNLPLVTLPLIVLFWAGVGHRIADYGLSESRVYLVACGAIMTATTALLAWRKRGVYLHITILSFVIFAALAYIKPISAERLAVSSQLRRVKTTAAQIGALDGEGHLVIGQMSPADSLHKAEHRRIVQSLRYIDATDSLALSALGLHSADQYSDGLSPYTATYANAYRLYIEPADMVEIEEEPELQYGAITIYCPSPVFYDIAGYSRMYCSYDSFDKTTTADGVLKLSSEDGSLNVAVAKDEILRTQLALIGRTTDNPPTNAELNAAAETLSVYRTDSLAIWFSYMTFDSAKAEDGTPSIRLTDVQIDCIAIK